MNFLVDASYIISGMLILLFMHLIINLLCFCRLSVSSWEKASPASLVSVLVPARNEQEHIEMCVRSLIGQHYEQLEVLVLDDQSTDATAAIVKRLIDELPATQKKRLRLLRGKPLPAGWVGKNFACFQLSQYAQGAYLFFTDADTVHAPETVRTVLEYMDRARVDLLTAQPGYELKGIGEHLLMPLLCFRVFTLLPLTLISRVPKPVLAVGNGPLLCFRRQAYKAAGGHKAIKEHILEDVTLARSVKAAGYRMAFVDAHKLLYCHMYTSFANMWTGFSKTFFAFYSYSLPAALAILFFDVTLFIVPPLLVLLSLFISLPRAVILLSLGNYCLAVLMRLCLACRFGRSQRVLTLLLCLLHPATVILGCLILLNSIRWHFRKLGTEWKGRYYSSQNSSPERLDC
ncbi:glycosyltransferase [Ktedonosporobacter rubrisoli]|uniref:Glycosyltransferase n=1 Tax=Ktedonosporobacter rubrisoli TaxID=2509675 RepID=A0A4P6JRG7_KTERU|nr:glycosyltransferase [Ktedonosporobacter rubrisoli]QBD77406.1 glycosyltransferase [Ktedonosporobacter rubrisoli]